VDPFQALRCDEVMYVVEEASVRLGSAAGAAQKETHLAPVNGTMPQYLAWLQKRFQAHGGENFADQRQTVADLKVLVDVSALNSGWPDDVPADLVQTVVRC